MRYRRSITLIVIFTLIVSGFSISLNFSESNKEISSKPGKNNKYESTSKLENSFQSHEPIRIDNNTDLAQTAQVEGWVGNGSSSDPYVIEDYEIESEEGYCIYIGNTTDRFILKDCYFHHADENFSYSNPPYFINSAVMLYNVENSALKNNTISSSADGIYLRDTDNFEFSDNIFNNNDRAINFASSDYIKLQNNTFINNGGGIFLSDSRYNTFRNNKFTNDSITIWGDRVGYWNTHHIDKSNTVNGKPIYYWKNKSSGTVPKGAGQVILANCKGVTISEQEIKGGTVGVQLGFSTNNTLIDNYICSHSEGIFLYESDWNLIIQNNVSKNGNGIYIRYSKYNTVKNNTAFNNGYGFNFRYSENNKITRNSLYKNMYGICLYDSDYNSLSENNLTLNDRDGLTLFESSKNIIYHNNFIDNNIHLSRGILHQAMDDKEDNKWYNGTINEGNYWSDYEGYDVDNDGIGDTPYDKIHETRWSKDQYPLIEPFDPNDPRADIGGPYSGDEETNITFDASNSSDNKKIILYEWDLDNDGSYDDATGVEITKSWKKPGKYTIGLKVTDNQNNSDADSTHVVVKDVTAPIANAGKDRTVNENTLITLNGKNSSDNVGIVNYTWIINGKKSRGVIINHTFEIVGEHEVKLKVVDMAGNYDTDTLTITVLDITDPNASIDISGKSYFDKNFTFKVDENITLNAYESRDNTEIVSYKWNFSDGTMATGEEVTHIYDKPGNYTITLTVIDQDGNKDIEELYITIEGVDKNKDIPIIPIVGMVFLLSIWFVLLYLYKRN